MICKRGRAIKARSGRIGRLKMRNGRQMLKRISKFVVLLLLAAPCAIAQQGRVYGESGNWTQEIVGSLGSAKILRVKIDMGSVKVVGDSQSGVNYSIHTHSYTSSEEKARREFENFKISTYVRGDTAWIVGDWEGGRVHRFSGDFVVNVPHDLEELKVETDGGNVEASGIAGRAVAESGGGNIRFDDIGGTTSAETGGGNIDVNSIGGDVHIDTGGGSVNIGSVKGKIDASTGGGNMHVVSGQGMVLEAGGGNIEVKQCGGTMKVSTGGGSIQLGDLNGGAEIETGGGSIRLSSAKGYVRAETGGGSIDLGTVPSAHAETGAGGITAKFIPWGGERHNSVLETSAGDITVYLVAGVTLSVRASIEVANGHRIFSDFPEIHVTTEGGDWGTKTVSAEGDLNGGGPELKVETMNGDISFRRANQ